MDREKVVLDIFGQFLMEHLRDRAISFSENLVQDKPQAPSLRPLQSKLSGWSTEQKQVMKQVVVRAIDYALHDFLFQIEEIGLRGLNGNDEHSIQILVDGIDLAGLSDGLHGLPFGEDGWEAKYSKFSPDAGWNQFIMFCTYKAAEAGTVQVVKVDPCHTSQVCSGCGTVRKKTLSERWHSCECGCELDRDHNAAINIKHLWLGRSHQEAQAS